MADFIYGQEHSTGKQNGTSNLNLKMHSFVSVFLFWSRWYVCI